jgi:ferric-dicitrate binding protein FerR (iron transport regulator)
VLDTLNRCPSGRILITVIELNGLKLSGAFSTKEPDAALKLITNNLYVQQIRLTDYRGFLYTQAKRYMMTTSFMY